MEGDTVSGGGVTTAIDEVLRRVELPLGLAVVNEVGEVLEGEKDGNTLTVDEVTLGAGEAEVLVGGRAGGA